MGKLCLSYKYLSTLKYFNNQILNWYESTAMPVFLHFHKKWVVFSYMVDIPGSDFPVRLMISFLSTVRRRVQTERGAWK
jgi:hypothetical protein